MNWAHLPVAGGIYDQHPQLLDEWIQIWRVKSQVEKEKQAKAEHEQKKASARKRSR